MGKHAFFGLVVAGVFVLDQTTKWYVARSFELHESLPVIEGFFHLTYVRNKGGAFGLLAGWDSGLRLPFFLVASALAIGFLFYFLRQLDERDRWGQFALGGIFGGALGNLVDRVRMGEVVDFFDFHFRGYAWPAFNIADSFITIGAVTLLFQSFFPRSGRH
ncbi:MAG: lipoprotein signal peptidase [Candidatus Binatia bacterium]|nr:MAG: lipoprotein signal peptidase [Candidatus Binatia bacterium]